MNGEDIRTAHGYEIRTRYSPREERFQSALYRDGEAVWHTFEDTFEEAVSLAEEMAQRLNAAHEEMQEPQEGPAQDDEDPSDVGRAIAMMLSRPARVTPWMPVCSSDHLKLSVYERALSTSGMVVRVIVHINDGAAMAFVNVNGTQLGSALWREGKDYHSLSTLLERTWDELVVGVLRGLLYGAASLAGTALDDDIAPTNKPCYRLIRNGELAGANFDSLDFNLEDFISGDGVYRWTVELFYRGMGDATVATLPHQIGCTVKDDKIVERGWYAPGE